MCSESATSPKAEAFEFGPVRDAGQRGAAMEGVIGIQEYLVPCQVFFSLAGPGNLRALRHPVICAGHPLPHVERHLLEVDTVEGILQFPGGCTQFLLRPG